MLLALATIFLNGFISVTGKRSADEKSGKNIR